MKKFSKVLCLVLVVVMMAGLCAVGTSAAFTDDAKIKNTEAVSVMTGLKVIKGNPDGSFAPNGTLTRAEAATIICKMLGATGLNITSTFTDTKGHWAESSIAYCAGNGIVAGVGNNKFNPEGTLTAEQWAVMLMHALGAKSGAEAGTPWQVATAMWVKNTKMAEGITFNGPANISRDDACQMAFNALFYGEKLETKNVYRVLYVCDPEAPEYNPDLGLIAKQSFDTFSDAYLLADKAAEDGDAWSVQAVKVTVTKDSLAETVFQLYNWSDVDGFGRTVNMYISFRKDLINNDPVIVPAAEPDYVVEGNITGAALYNMVGYRVAGMLWNNYVDGVSAPNAFKPVKNSNVPVFDGNANGAVTYIYVDNDLHQVKTCTVTERVGEVRKVIPAVDGAKRMVQLTNGLTFVTEQFAAKDVVLYTCGTKGVASMTKAEVVTGTLTKITEANGAKTFTVGGNAYKVSMNAPANTGYATANLNKEVSFYVDSQGNMILNKTAAAADAQYILVLANSDAKTTNYLTGGISTVDVYGVDANGETLTLTVEEINGLDVANTDATEVPNVVYTYTKNPATGNYVLGDAGWAVVGDIASKATLVNLDNGSTAILNSATKFMFIEQVGNGNLSVKNIKTIVGNSNIATIDNTNGIAFAVLNNKGIATAVLVIGNGNNAVIDTKDLVYVTGVASTSTTENTGATATTTYTYPNAYTVDGKKTMTSVNAPVALGLYYINDKGGVGASVATTTATVTGVMGSTIELDGTTYNVTAKTAVIFAGKADTELQLGQTVEVVINSNTDDVDVIVVTGDQETSNFNVIGGSTRDNQLIRGVVNIVTITGEPDADFIDICGETDGSAVSVTNMEETAPGVYTIEVTVALGYTGPITLEVVVGEPI